MKEKAKRNKTIDFPIEEGQRYIDQCIKGSDIAGYDGNLTDRLILGDALNVMNDLPRSFVDLLIVDPPYNISKNFHGNIFNRTTEKKYADYTEKWLVKVTPLLKKTASIYVCCDWKSSLIIGRVLSDHFMIRNRITWEREKGRGAKANWKNSMEDIWFATVSSEYHFDLDKVKVRKKVIAPYKVDGKPKDWVENKSGSYRDTCPGNFWNDLSVPYWSMPENTAHPTQKPEKLYAKLLLASSREGDMVFDPFAGACTTAVTAKKLNRHYLCIEQNELYLAWGGKRLEMADTDKTIQGYEDGIFHERNYRG